LTVVVRPRTAECESAPCESALPSPIAVTCRAVSVGVVPNAESACRARANAPETRIRLLETLTVPVSAARTPWLAPCTWTRRTFTVPAGLAFTPRYPVASTSSTVVVSPTLLLTANPAFVEALGSNARLLLTVAPPNALIPMAPSTAPGFPSAVTRTTLAPFTARPVRMFPEPSWSVRSETVAEGSFTPSTASVVVPPARVVTPWPAPTMSTALPEATPALVAVSVPGPTSIRSRPGLPGSPAAVMAAASVAWVWGPDGQGPCTQ
jgi:hypothetical protein